MMPIHFLKKLSNSVPPLVSLSPTTLFSRPLIKGIRETEGGTLDLFLAPFAISAAGPAFPNLGDGPWLAEDLAGVSTPSDPGSPRPPPPPSTLMGVVLESALNATLTDCVALLAKARAISPAALALTGNAGAILRQSADQQLADLKRIWSGEKVVPIPPYQLRAPTPPALGKTQKGGPPADDEPFYFSEGNAYEGEGDADSKGDGTEGDTNGGEGDQDSQGEGSSVATATKTSSAKKPLPGSREWALSFPDWGSVPAGDLDHLLRYQQEEAARRAACVSRSVSPTGSVDSRTSVNALGHRYDHNPTLLTEGYDVDIDDCRQQRVIVRANRAEWEGSASFPTEAVDTLLAREREENPDVEGARPEQDALSLPGLGPPTLEATQAAGPDTYGRYFTAQQLLYIQEVLVASVGTETARQYLAGPRHWNGFRATLEESNRPSEFMAEHLGKPLLQAIWLILFCKYANEVHGFFGRNLGHLLAGLAFHFRCNSRGNFDSRMFQEETLRKAMQAFALPPVAVCELIAQQVEHEKQPFSREFLSVMRQTHWSPVPPLRPLYFDVAKHVEMMQAYVCLIYMLSWGSRGQNIVVTAARSKMLLNGTVVYTFLTGRDPLTTVSLNGGGPARQYMRTNRPEGGHFDYSLVLCVEYVVEITKTTNCSSSQAKGKAIKMPATIRLVGDTPMERHAMDVMATWEVNAYGLPTDPVATVYYPSKKVRKSQVNKAGIPVSAMVKWNGVEQLCARREPNSGSLAKIYKEVASREECGALEPQHISIGSARKFFTSNAEGIKKFAQTVAPTQGLEVDEVIQRLGGWAGPAVPALHYTKAQTTNSNFSLLKDGVDQFLLTGAQIKSASDRRKTMARGAAGRGAGAVAEERATPTLGNSAPQPGTSHPKPPAKQPRSTRAATSVVDVLHSDSSDEFGQVSDPSTYVKDSRGDLHDPKRVVCSLADRPINFALPFVQGLAVGPSVLKVAPPRGHYVLGNALVVTPPAYGRTGQPLEEFKGDLYRTDSRPVPPPGRGCYVINCGRGWSMDCTRAYAEGRCIASASNTALGLITAEGTALKSTDNNCHVAIDWTDLDRPRPYLYLSRPLPKDPTARPELMWPFGAAYKPSDRPLTMENLDDFLPPSGPPAKKPRRE